MEHLIQIISKLLGVDPTILNALFSLLGLIIAFATFLLGIPFAFLLYKKRRFLNHITYSINILEKDTATNTWTLQLRTVQVLPREDLLPSNPIFVWKFLLAIRRCTTLNPFILMDEQGMNILQPAIINGLSAVIGEGALREAAGMEVIRKEKFLFAVVCEKYGPRRTQKIQVILALPELLSEVFREETITRDSVVVERAHHADRIETLVRMANRRESESALPEDSIKAVRFIELYFT